MHSKAAAAYSLAVRYNSSVELARLQALSSKAAGELKEQLDARRREVTALTSQLDLLQLATSAEATSAVKKIVKDCQGMKRTVKVLQAECKTDCVPGFCGQQTGAIPKLKKTEMVARVDTRPVARQIPTKQQEVVALERKLTTHSCQEDARLAAQMQNHNGAASIIVGGIEFNSNGMAVAKGAD